jgi:MGT family glycosyltransferase
MYVLISTTPVAGHVTPALPICQELVRQGHTIFWHTGIAFKPYVEEAGAIFIPIKSSIDFSDLENIPQELMAKRQALKGISQLQFDLKSFFFDAALGQIQDLKELIKNTPIDIMLGDNFNVGLSWFGEITSIPWAQFGVSVYTASSTDTAPFGLGILPDTSFLGKLRNQILNGISRFLILGDVLKYNNLLRKKIQLPPHLNCFFDQISPYLFIANSVEEFEYPRQDLAPQVHFVGPLLPDTSKLIEIPSWWDELKQCQQPVIHITQGTVATNPEQLIIPSLKALKDEPVKLIVTTGDKSPDFLDPQIIPENARVTKLLPYRELLPYVDIFISNGGFNGVQFALMHGIPLIVAGTTEDKKEVCSRVQWSGVGLNLGTQYPHQYQIRNAVLKVLEDRSFKQRALYFKDKILLRNSAKEAVKLITKLAQTSKPVLR